MHRSVRQLSTPGLVFVLAFVCASVPIGCGGSAEDQLAEAHANFVSHAEAACEKALVARDEAVGAALQRMSDPNALTKLKFAESVLPHVLPTMRKLAKDLSKLNPPDSDAEPLAEIVEGLERGVASAEEHPRAFLRGGEPAMEETARRAEELGLRSCARV